MRRKNMVINSIKIKTLITLFLVSSVQLNLRSQEQTLQHYLSAGMENSPVLKEYENNANLAGLENEKVISDFHYPTVQADVNWMEAPVINGVGYDQAITNGAWYSALAGVSMPLFTKALSLPELEKNSLLAGKSQWQSKMGWKEISLQITDLYAQCYADQQNLENAKDQLDVITNQHKLSK